MHFSIAALVASSAVLYSIDARAAAVPVPTPPASRTSAPPNFERPAGSTPSFTAMPPRTSRHHSHLDGVHTHTYSGKSSGARSMKREDLDARPTPDPTGVPSDTTTVHISSVTDFSLLLPGRQGELVSDSESDGVSFCTSGSTAPHCAGRPAIQEGFVRAAAIEQDPDGAWIQITGCLDASKSTLDPADNGGQLDVRFPNGAQCTFGGYGASFIELVEPSLNRFCLRCCRDHGDQVNCNSHRDRLGCENAVPGTYDFPDLGVSCA